MKTIFNKQISGSNRKWYLIDANNIPVGRLSTRIVELLRGKNKTDFSYHQDNGGYVIVVNSEKVKLSGNKEQNKIYREHSQFMGWLKEISAQELRQKTPEKIVEHAIFGMLPKTKHRKDIMKRLKVVIGENHDHCAQKPTIITV